MGIMDQIWILLSAGAVWVMVREAEKADAKAYFRRKVAENRRYMRDILIRDTCQKQIDEPIQFYIQTSRDDK